MRPVAVGDVLNECKCGLGGNGVTFDTLDAAVPTHAHMHSGEGN